jgi:glutathione S-transferase
VFYAWGLRRGYPMQELKNFTAMKDSMLQRPAVQQVLGKEKSNL